jgi:two-component system KDP operon response regulator KdpE
MEHKKRILVVDDEPHITIILRRALLNKGYDVKAIADGESAFELCGIWRPDLVVTDLSMPNLDGVEVCKRLRAVSTAPIIVLSVRGDESTKVEALNAGADDYLTKPFGMDELLARIRAGLRRSPATTEVDSVILQEDFRIDFERRDVRVCGKQIHLSPKEFDLLAYFLRNPGKVLTHRSILTKVWGWNDVEQIEYLRVFVRHLRKKIELNPASPKYIRTEPWVGYRFVPGK